MTAVVKPKKAGKSKVEKRIKTFKNNWVRDVVDSATEQNQPFWNDPVKYHRASVTGDPCIRSLAFNMLGHQSPKEARVLRIFRTGNLIEQTNLEMMKTAGILVSSQGEIHYTFTSYQVGEHAGDPEEVPFIVGHYDAIIKDKDEKRYLVEIKSINERAFDKLPPEHDFMMAGDSPVMKQFPKYIHQWNTYSGADINAPDGFLLFEAKNTQRHKYYFLHHDQELLAKNLYKLEEAWGYGLNEEIPAIPDGFNPKSSTDKACGWCDKKYLCKELSEGVVKLTDIKQKDAELRS